MGLACGCEVGDWLERGCVTDGHEGAEQTCSHAEETSLIYRCDPDTQKERQTTKGRLECLRISSWKCIWFGPSCLSSISVFRLCKPYAPVSVFFFCSSAHSWHLCLFSGFAQPVSPLVCVCVRGVTAGGERFDGCDGPGIFTGWRSCKAGLGPRRWVQSEAVQVVLNGESGRGKLRNFTCVFKILVCNMS